ncbi:Ig-like domain-containing protein [Sunxiuqinia sp. A32]|uniref:Ig-like domain-containing protein n=1 Tax=Sunxiuqinia sp. A32 TaxID=3461496 RepID=UPI00404635E8
MRKSFTQLFSIFILICAFGFTSFGEGIFDDTYPTGTNVDPTTTEFAVKFMEDIQFTANGGTFTIYKDGSPIEAIVVSSTSTDVSIIDGDSLVITSGVTLEENMSYSVILTAGSVETVATPTGNGEIDWGFTVGDYTAPVVNTLDPENGATNVYTEDGFSLTISFTDANTVDPVEGGKFWIYQADGTVVDIIEMNEGNTTVNLDGSVTVDVAAGAYFYGVNSYYVNVEAGAFKDDTENANEFAGIMDNTTWTFTTAVYEAPTFVSAAVSNVTDDSADFDATLSEAGTVYFTVNMSEEAPTAATLFAGGPGYFSATTDEDGVIETADLTPLNDGVTYYIHYTAESSFGVESETVGTIEFTTVDVTKPSLESNSELATDNVTTGLKLVFDEDVVTGTGNIEIRLQSNNEVVRTIAAADLMVDAEDASIVTASFAGLENEVGYYVLVDDAIVADATGNTYDSDFVVATDWMFTSADSKVPTATVAMEVAASPNGLEDVIVTFSEDVQLVDGTDVATLNGQNQTVWFPYITLEEEGEELPFTATYAAMELVITPTIALDPMTTYQVKIRPNTVEDLSENPFSAVEVFLDVTTENFTTPAVDVDYDMDGVSGVVTYTFNKPVYIGGVAAESADFTVTYSDGGAVANAAVFAGTTLTITPAADLAEEVEYTVDVDTESFEDEFGVAFPSLASLVFTTPDVTAPTATFSHEDPYTTVNADGDLTITFDEEVGPSPASSDLVVVFKADDKNGADLDAAVSFDGTVVTINPDADLVDGNTYYYGVGAVTDGTNVVDAQFRTFTYSPAYPDVVELSSSNPNDGATGVELAGGDLVVMLTFDQNVKPNPGLSGAATLHLASDDSEIASQTLEAGDFDGSIVTLTFTPGAAWTSETDYYINIEEDIIVSSSSNEVKYGGILDATTLNFTSKDTDAPTIAAVEAFDGLELTITITETGSGEDLKAGTGNVTISSAEGDEYVVAIGDFDIDGAVATYTQTVTNYSTDYTIEYGATILTDLADNASNPLDPGAATSGDNTAPGVDTLVPADGAELVDINTVFTIKWDEPVVLGEAGTSIFLVEDVDKNESGATIDAVTGNLVLDGTDLMVAQANIGVGTDVVLNGTTATINFGVTLVDGKDYYVLVQAEAFKDIVTPASKILGNEEISAGDWAFTTRDVVAPELTSVTYDEVVVGEGIAIGSTIVLTFDKPLELVTPAGGEILDVDIANYFTITIGGADAEFTGTVNEAKDQFVLTLVTPLTEEDSDEPVVVDVADGVLRGKTNEVVMAAGADYETTFKVSDYVAPTATLTAPVAAASGTEISFSITSDDSAGKAYYIVQAGGDAPDAATIMADGVEADFGLMEIDGLMSETLYDVYAVVTDEVGNVSDVVTDDVTTPDVTAPIADALPTMFDKDNVMTIAFDDDMVLGGLTTAVLYNAETLNEAGAVSVSVSDDTNLTFDVSSLTPADGDEFIIVLVGGPITDEAGNEWADVPTAIGDNAWIAAIADRTAPTAVFAPVSDVLADQVFTLTFDENVMLTEGASFIVYNGDDDEIFEIVDAANVTVVDNVVTIDPDRLFWVEEANDTPHSFYIDMEAGSVKDMSGNVWVPIEMDFTTIDNVAPTTEFDPADGDTDVPVASNITITFSEAVTMPNGTVIDSYDLDSLLYLTVDGEALDFAASYAAEVITIVPAESFVEGTTYVVGMKEKFIDDAGNVAAAKEVSFTTVETIVTPVPNENVMISPDNEDALNPTIIPIGQEFKAHFGGQVYRYSETAQYNNIKPDVDYLETAFKITNTDATVDIDFTVSIEEWTEDTTIFVLTPADNLDSETNYMVKLYSNYLQIGTAYSDPLNLGYTDQTHVIASNDYITVDVIAPEVEVYMPAVEATATKDDVLALNFNEDVKVGTGMIQIYTWNGLLEKEVDVTTLVPEEGDEDTDYVKIIDLSEIPTNNEYYVIVPAGAFLDLSDNPFAGLLAEDDWSFLVRDDANPGVASYAPMGNYAAKDSWITIEMDRNVDLSDAGYVAIYDEEGVALEIFRISDNAAAFVRVNDRTFTIDPDMVFTEGATYKVELAAGTFEADVDATLKNPAFDWMFTVEITKAPEVTAKTPADDATEVDVNTMAEMIFDVPVQAGSGMIELHINDGATIVHTFDVTSDEVMFDLDTVRFDLSAYLEDMATEYYIIVPEGAIMNMSSTSPMAFAGYEQTYDWNFSTVSDATAPMALTYSPNAETIEDNHPDALVITFDEAVALSEMGGNLMITGVGGTDALVTVALTAEMVSEDGMTVTVTYDAAVNGGLDKNSDYFVTVEAGALEDIAGNAWEGVADETTWTFTTGADFQTGIEDQVSGSLEFKVYPNPFDGYVTVDNANELSRIVISNIVGQPVKDIVNPTGTINTGDLSSGIYVITLVKDGEVVKAERIVKR